jgi:hypothetical protein
MSEQEPTSAPPASKAALDPLISSVEKYARKEPTKAVSAAFGAGLILTLLPVGGLVRLLFIALRPLLLILGFIKLYEEIESRRQRPADPQEPEEDPQA